MLADWDAIDQNIRHHRDTLESHKNAPPFPLCRNWQRPLIPRWTAIVALRQLRIGRQSIRAVHRIPSVRNSDNLPWWRLKIPPFLCVLIRSDVALEEFPIGFQQQKFTSTGLRGGYENHERQKQGNDCHFFHEYKKQITVSLAAYT